MVFIFLLVNCSFSFVEIFVYIGRTLTLWLVGKVAYRLLYAHQIGPYNIVYFSNAIAGGEADGKVELEMC